MICLGPPEAAVDPLGIPRAPVNAEGATLFLVGPFFGIALGIPRHLSQSLRNAYGSLMNPRDLRNSLMNLGIPKEFPMNPRDL